MSIREQNKALNREKILDSASTLVREGGLEALSMRPLAERANVSSRTLYNLFGSKTAVLIALASAPLAQVANSEPPKADVLPQIFSMLEKIYQAYAPQLDYYRDIYWGIMSSDHQEARISTLERARQAVIQILERAIATGELTHADAPTLANHMVLLGLGLLGLWASRLISDLEMLAHMKQMIGDSMHEHISQPPQA